MEWSLIEVSQGHEGEDYYGQINGPVEQHKDNHLRTGQVWKTLRTSVWYMKIVYEMCQAVYGIQNLS